MICGEAQDRILADNQGALPAEVVAHIESCPDCAAFQARVERLDRTVRALPVPPDSDRAKSSFLRQLRSRQFSTKGISTPFNLLLGQGWRAAAAAVFVLLLGGTIWLASRRTPPINSTDRNGLASKTSEPTSAPTTQEIADSTVVDKLLDINVDLAEASTPEERKHIFTERATPLKSTFEQLPVSDEKALAGQLFENGRWLSSNSDVLEEAERFDGVAHLFFDQLETAAPSGDSRIIARLTRRYGLAAYRLDSEKIKLARASNLNPEQKRRLERLIKRQAEQQRRLEDLLQHAPEMSKQQMRAQLEQVQRSLRKRHHASRFTPTTTP